MTAVEDRANEHGPEECLYDNLRKQNAIVCACGYHAMGDTWEECGADMDNHLDENE